MGMAMVGLIIVQTYWIRYAISIKEKQFSQLVNTALSEAVQEFHRQQAMRFISQEFDPVNLDSNITFRKNGYYFDTTINLSFDGDTNLNVRQRMFFYHHSSGPDGGSNLTIINDDTLLNLDKATAGNQQVGVNNSRDKESYTRYLRQMMEERRKFVDDIVSQMFDFDFDINQQINLDELSTAITQVFHSKGISPAFEFAISNQNNRIALKSRGFNPDNNAVMYSVKLFPGDFFHAPTQLMVYFPGITRFIFRSLGFMTFSSMLLTIILIVSFMFTIIIIFRQKKLSEMKSDFVNNMTHELKTPISTISLASQMLHDKSIPKQAKNLDNISGIIIDESKKLGHQVEKVLQMAVFDSGKVKLKFKETDMHTLIANVINTFELQIKNKGGLIIPSLHAKNPLVNVDMVHITNVLSNLTDNALKYCETEPEIYIETDNYPDQLMVSVRDNGIGISREEQKRIFDKFYRISTGNIHNVKGFGLGLSYVKKIVDEHRGDIKIESEKGEGTVFRIYLPQ